MPSRFARVMCVLVLACAVCPTAAHADALPHNGMIAFSAEHTLSMFSHSWALEAVQPDGTNHTTLDANDGGDKISWLPDGQHYVYSSQQRLHLAGLDGSDSVLTNLGSPVANAAVSPDGTKIAYGNGSSNDWEIYVADLAGGGTNVRQVTNSPATDLLPAWAPDGRSLVFLSERNGMPGIFRVDAGATREDSPAYPVTTPGLYSYAPVFSPDGQEIVFASDRGGSWQLYRAPAATAAVVADGATPLAFSHPGDGDRNAVFSPDGTKIAFVRNNELWSASFDRDDAARVIALGGDVTTLIFPAWQPILAADGGALTITGTVRPGQQLTAAHGADSGTGPITDLGYQWSRCDSGACTDIPSATSASYTITDDDRGHQLNVTRTVSNTLGTTSKASAPTSTVQARPGLPALASWPASISSDPRPSFAFSGAAGDYECTVDGAARACASPFTVPTALGDGGHTFQVVAVNAYGERSSAASYIWTVDTAAPAAPTVLAGPDARTAGRDATVTFAGEDGATLECALDATAFAACTSPLALHGLAQGQHVVTIRQTDRAGNTSDAATVTWTIADTVAPPKPSHRVDAVIAGHRLDGQTLVTVAPDQHFAVGCRLDQGALRACHVRLTYTVTHDGRSRTYVIGGGTVTYAARGPRTTAVASRLNALGRRLLKSHPLGLPVTVRTLAKTVDHRRLVDRAQVRLILRSSFVLPVNVTFTSRGSVLSGSLRMALHRIAGQLRGAKTVTCAGSTDSRGASRANRQLGLRRAQVTCNYLRHAGVRAKLRRISYGEARPRATNRTAAGRNANRHVVVAVAF